MRPENQATSAVKWEDRKPCSTSNTLSLKCCTNTGEQVGDGVGSAPTTQIWVCFYREPLKFAQTSALKQAWLIQNEVSFDHLQSRDLLQVNLFPLFFEKKKEECIQSHTCI